MQIAGGGINITGGVAISSWTPYTTYGKLYTWGSNQYGQLGNGTTTDRSSPGTTANGGTTWATLAVPSGTTRGWQAAIKTDGTLWMWGYDHYGHLNNGSFTADTSSPNTTLTGGTNWVSIGTGQDHIAAIKTDGTLWSWGRGLEGEMGNNTNTQSNSSPLQEITGSTNWTQVSAGSYSTYAIKTDGTLWTWGYNNLGQLGNGTNGTSNNTRSPGTVAGGGTTWKYAVGGGYHAAALKTDGTLWTWGQGLYGALANGAPNNTASPGTVSGGGTTWSQLSCSTNHIAAIKTDGTLWTSGANNFGQLGDGTTTNRSSFATVAGGGTTWSQVSAGPALAAIKTDGTLWTCGYNNYGELGNGTTVSTSSLAQIASGINTWRSVYAGTYYIMAIAQ